MSGKTVAELIDYGVRELRERGKPSPRLDVELILAHVLGKDRLFLYMNPGLLPGFEAEREFCRLIGERIRGKPVQYIIGRQEFMGLEFDVSSGVLIPRPDTEVLVESVIEWIKDSGRHNAVLADLGTGSGAIAVSLAYYIPDARVVAVDVSQEALEVAAHNAAKHGVSRRIRFVRGDLLEPFKAMGLEGGLDGIVSNPPYIPEEDMKGLQDEVKNEPALALCGGSDGLDCYRRIAAGAPLYLARGGILAVEVGYNQAGDVAGIVGATGKFGPARVIRDLEGRERVVFFVTI
ncbi:MAG: Peptide chain release factor N(5)-glutamine methyltransferase [Firmicutes bacterium]|nr:Peptide chain release factor N(5)-glutamine methyltransferase [Bacillota bacterium]